MSEAPLIDLRDLHVSAGGREILHVDRLRLQPREMLAVLGPNGAGKSTLLRCLVGMQGFRAARAEVLGRRIDTLGGMGFCRLRRRVGYLPQLLAARSELPLTVREVVAVGRSGLGGLLRPLGRRDWSLVDEWIDRLGLSDLRRQRYGDLSGGEQRKTLLARVMVQQPRLLLLDEPTANLDLAWREEVVSLLEELYRQSHLPMVLICHELEVLPPSCSHALLLENGRVRAYGHPAAVLTDETIADLLSPALAVLRRGRRFAVVPREGGE